MQEPLWERNKAEHEAQAAESKEMKKTLDRIDVALRGNGEPGIRSDVEMLKQWAAATRKLYWVGIAAVVAMILNVLSDFVKIGS